jgi:general secretion pathway protein L
MIQTMIFLSAAEPARWIRLVDGRVGGDGIGLTGIPVADPSVPAETIAVVPGDAVVLHWVPLPQLAPAQAAAAARMLAADVTTTPLDATHVAIGRRDADGQAPLALVGRAQMAEWLETLAAVGIDPDRMLPAPLLLPLPETGVTIAETDGQWQVRGARLALAAEPGLAELLIGDQPRSLVDDRSWRAGLAAALAAAPIDLRQGAFARARRLPIDPRRARRIAQLALAVFGVVVATGLIGVLRQSTAADQTELALADAARAALPRGTIITDPRAQVAARLASLGGATPAFTALAAPLLAGVRDRPSISLETLAFAPGSGLNATIAAPVAADRDALAAMLSAQGLVVNMGAPREEAGRQMVDLAVKLP